MKKVGRILAVAALILAAVPAFAAFDEKDLEQTLATLRYELSRENTNRHSSNRRLNDNNTRQHADMVELIRRCDELSLVLYSQGRDYTFDITYSLHKATSEYEAFQKDRRPYDEIIGRMDEEIDRYQRLIRSLKRIPPVVTDPEENPDDMVAIGDSLKAHSDSIIMSIASTAAAERLAKREEVIHGHSTFTLEGSSLEDRDSCLVYAQNLLEMYTVARASMLIDNDHYEETDARMKESFDYAMEKYRELQKSIFLEGQDSFIKILKNPGAYWSMLGRDFSKKYNQGRLIAGSSNWSRDKVIAYFLHMLVMLAIATGISCLAMRLAKPRVKNLRLPKYKKKLSTVTAIGAIIIFSLIINIVGTISGNTFFIEADKLIMLYAWLLALILISMTIRHDQDRLEAGKTLFLPIMIMGLIVFLCRMVFLPNRAINFFLPILLILSTVWQSVMNAKAEGKVHRGDRILAWISFAILLGSSIASLAGFVFMAIQVIVWWLFQLTAIEVVMAVYEFIRLYEDGTLQRKREKYSSSRGFVTQKVRNGDFIRVTWFHDLFKTAIVPLVAIYSFQLCLWFAAGVFGLSAIVKDIYNRQFFDLVNASGQEILSLSLHKIVISLALYFIFRYVCYFLKSIFRIYKYDAIRQKNKSGVIQDSDVNLTLANNLIGIGTWGAYVITLFTMLKVPTGALSIVAAGLATGIGLALKDVLNNFIYGIQLMSGRIRVGDYVECEGVRGKVESITYQSTQIETLEGTIMSITNTELFNRKFTNLTRNNPYEFLKIVVGVEYGTDIEEVRLLISQALKEETEEKDSYGRHVVDRSRGITVAFENFGESSVDLAVKQFVLVARKAAYTSRAKEIIYNTLNENGISIPFPQRDVHVIETK